MHKFQTLNIARHTTHPIITDKQIISYTNKATVLGPTFTTSSFTQKKLPTTRRVMAMKTLNRYRLQRFRNISANNKRRLYKTIIRPQLLYPIISLNSVNTISHSSYRKLQQVQNEALRFIDNTKFTDRIPSTTLHTRNEPPAINTYIHRRAINAWTQMHDKNPDLYDTMKPEADELTRHTNFPTSFLTAETPEPRQIYV